MRGYVLAASVVDVVGEFVLRAIVARLERHFAGRAGVFAGAAGDGEDRIAAVVKRPFDDDLAVRQKYGPGAFPGFADDRPDATALIGPDLVRVLRVKDVVGEHERVADGIAFG